MDISTYPVVVIDEKIDKHNRTAAAVSNTTIDATLTAAATAATATSSVITVTNDPCLRRLGTNFAKNIKLIFRYLKLKRYLMLIYILCMFLKTKRQ